MQPTEKKKKSSKFREVMTRAKSKDKQPTKSVAQPTNQQANPIPPVQTPPTRPTQGPRPVTPPQSPRQPAFNSDEAAKERRNKATEIEEGLSVGKNLAGVSKLLGASAEKGGIDRGFEGMKYKGKGDFGDILDALKSIEHLEEKGMFIDPKDLAALTDKAKKWLDEDKKDMVDNPERKYDPVSVRKRQCAEVIHLHGVAQQALADMKNATDPATYAAAQQQAQYSLYMCQSTSQSIQKPPDQQKGGDEDKLIRQELKTDAADRVAVCMKGDGATKNKVAVQVAKLYLKYTDPKSGVITVPCDVAFEMQKLLEDDQISKETKQKLEEAIAAVTKLERAIGFEAASQLPKTAHHDRAEVLNRHGCFKRTAGGTSDVRLLQNDDGSIAYAFKTVAGESEGGLAFLKLAKGAASMREDISSTISSEIARHTQLDLGFPNASIESLDGVRGALIEGLRGKMVDPEEREQAARSGEAETVAKLDKNIMEIPDQITPASLQKVVLSSVMTGQWDVKWGNMIVDSDNARPIDGGCAIPTKAVLRGFYDVDKRNPGPPSLDAVTCYPQGHPNSGQTMPAAQQAMDPATVNAILALPVDQVIAQAKARRDQLVQNKGFDPSLMQDECFDIVEASMTSAQNILTGNPTISLAGFAAEYMNWFDAYAHQDPVVQYYKQIRDEIEGHPKHFLLNSAIKDTKAKTFEAMESNLAAVPALIADMKKQLKIGDDFLTEFDELKADVEALKTKLTEEAANDPDAVAQQLMDVEELTTLMTACRKPLFGGTLQDCLDLWPPVAQKAQAMGL